MIVSVWKYLKILNKTHMKTNIPVLFLYSFVKSNQNIWDENWFFIQNITIWCLAFNMYRKNVYFFAAELR